MYALIHDNQLLLGPIKYNYRLINSELEELEIESRVSPRSYEDVPIYLDDNTALVPAIEIIPHYDPRLQGVGNFEWEIIRENDIPVRVEMTYIIGDRPLEIIKAEHKSLATLIRKEKETSYVDVILNGTTISVPSTREHRFGYITKLNSSSGPYNFKFSGDLWMKITSEDLENIIKQIDSKVQEAFDWEYTKHQEIDACKTGEEVCNVILREPEKIIENPDAIRTNN